MSDPKAEGRWLSNYVYEGCFSIDVPRDTIVRDEGTRAVFSLPTIPSSALMARIFEPKSGALVSKEVLQSEIARFMIEIAQCDEFHIAPPVDVDEAGVLSFQATGETSGSQWWMVRIYGRHGSKEYLLVDWKGSKDQALDPVLSVLVSIKLLIEPEASEADGAAH